MLKTTVGSVQAAEGEIKTPLLTAVEELYTRMSSVSRFSSSDSLEITSGITLEPVSVLLRIAMTKIIAEEEC